MSCSFVRLTYSPAMVGLHGVFEKCVLKIEKYILVVHCLFKIGKHITASADEYG